jgi:hypothetical protein
LRLAVIFNWWRQRPEGVGPWAGSGIYRSLSGKPQANRAAQRPPA